MGEFVTITCTFDMPLTSLEWLYNDKVVSSTVAPQLNLTFSPVNDTINNRQYICRAVTSYGVQEEDIIIEVKGNDRFNSSKLFKNFIY